MLLSSAFASQFLHGSCLPIDTNNDKTYPITSHWKMTNLSHINYLSQKSENTSKRNKEVQYPSKVTRFFHERTKERSLQLVTKFTLHG